MGLGGSLGGCGLSKTESRQMERGRRGAPPQARPFTSPTCAPCFLNSPHLLLTKSLQLHLCLAVGDIWSLWILLSVKWYEQCNQSPQVTMIDSGWARVLPDGGSGKRSPWERTQSHRTSVPRLELSTSGIFPELLKPVCRSALHNQRHPNWYTAFLSSGILLYL